MEADVDAEVKGAPEVQPEVARATATRRGAREEGGGEREGGGGRGPTGLSSVNKKQDLIY